MLLHEAIAAAGMSPPTRIMPGRWLRFPGVGKGKSNRAGWCRLITPTLAIYGDWSTGISEVWRDNAHQDTEETRRLLREAREREARFLAEQRNRQAQIAHEAGLLIERAFLAHHPYLCNKGFPEEVGLVISDRLLIPMRDMTEYRQLINVQQIFEDGTKRFLTGGRAKGAIHRLGSARPWFTALCEGYATGLSLHAALKLVKPRAAVIVCFSATNLELVAKRFPEAVVATDNDASRTGEGVARKTGLKWCMPPDIGTDFNDLHQAKGIHAVVEVLRAVF